MVKLGKATDLFKPLKKGDRLTVVYVYADGHASAGFERRIRDVDRSVRYFKQIDSLGFQTNFKGRIIFSDMSGGTTLLRAWMAAGMDALRARPASTDSGSEKTKEMKIEVGYLSAHIAGIGEITDYSMPRLMSGAWFYQADTEDEFDRDLETFGGSDRIAETIVTVQHPIRRTW